MPSKFAANGVSRGIGGVSLAQVRTGRAIGHDLDKKRSAACDREDGKPGQVVQGLAPREGMYHGVGAARWPLRRAGRLIRPLVRRFRTNAALLPARRGRRQSVRMPVDDGSAHEAVCRGCRSHSCLRQFNTERGLPDTKGPRGASRPTCSYSSASAIRQVAL